MGHSTRKTGLVVTERLRTYTSSLLLGLAAALSPALTHGAFSPTYTWQNTLYDRVAYATPEAACTGVARSQGATSGALGIYAHPGKVECLYFTPSAGSAGVWLYRSDPGCPEVWAQPSYGQRGFDHGDIDRLSGKHRCHP